MKHTDTKKTFKPIVPAPHSRGPIPSLSPLTPNPSPTMSPEDPKHQTNRRDSSSVHEVSAPSPSGRRLSKNSGSHPYSQQQQLPTLNDLNIATSPITAPAGPSSSSRPPHSYYGASTPPMSPGHARLSPISRPHCGITDPSQYSSSGFYQLPPPLQSYAPRQSPHHSPAMHPQSGHHSRQALPPLPPLPSALHSSSSSASSNGYSSPRGTTTPQMSPLPNHYLFSPGLGPMISPYPTPQHQPRHFPSPHHDSLGHSKNSIPAMILPASALSTSETAPTSGEITATLRSYSTLLAQEEHVKETSVFEERPSSSSSSSSTSATAPASTRRFSMLPPQSTKVTTPSHGRSSRSQTRKSITGSKSSDNGHNGTSSSSSSSSKGEGDPASSSTPSSKTTTTTTATTTTRRRGSSNTKIIDQETRDLMRKVSHSAIERRRRERINDKILQLKHLVPACVDEDHLHKLSILQSTIEYIQHLRAILPASIANTKIGKATNNNPNNKTTDMLEALGGSITAKFPLTPLMTTGLNHIHAKRIKMESQELAHSSSATTGASSSDDSHPHLPQSQYQHHEHHEHPLVDNGHGGPPSATSSTSSSASLDHLSRSMSLSSSSSSSTSSDDDAKDGLLLLAGQSSAAAAAMEDSNPHKRAGSRKKAHAKQY